MNRADTMLELWVCPVCGRPGPKGSVCADTPNDPWPRERLELSSSDLLGLFYGPRG